MTSHRIRIPGYRIDKNGKLVKARHRQSVSDRLKSSKSKRVRVAKRTAP